MNPFAGNSQPSSLGTSTNALLDPPQQPVSASQALDWLSDMDVQPLSSTQSARAPSSPPASASQRDREVEAFDAASVAASTATTVTSSQLSLESFRLAQNKHPGRAKRAQKRAQDTTSNTMSKQQRTLDGAMLERKVDELAGYQAATQHGITAKGPVSVPSTTSPATNAPPHAAALPTAAPPVNTAAVPAAPTTVTAAAIAIRPQPLAPQPRIVYTKLTRTAASGPSSSSALLVTIRPLTLTAAAQAVRFRKRVLDTLGRPMHTTTQYQRGWGDFVTAVLEESKSIKLLKDLAPPSKCATHIAAYLSNPFAQSVANAMEEDGKPTSASNSSSSRRAPKHFVNRPGMAVTGPVYVVAHFSQPTVAAHVETTLHKALQQGNAPFLQLERQQSSTDYFTVKFNYDFSEEQPFEMEVQRMDEELQRIGLKDYDHDEASYEAEFYDRARNRTAPVLLMATGSESVLFSPFFAERQVEVYVQPPAPCFGCGQYLTANFTHNCKDCASAARQRAEVKGSAGSTTEPAAYVFCFTCRQRVPSSHIGHCDCAVKLCLRCNSKQHNSLQCALSKRRFIPLGETHFARAANSRNGASHAGTGAGSSGSSGHRGGLVPLSAVASASQRVAIAPAALPTAPQSATRQETWASAVAGAAASPPTPPSTQSQQGDKPSPHSSDPSSAGVYQLRLEMKEHLALMEEQRRQDNERFSQTLQQILSSINANAAAPAMVNTTPQQHTAAVEEKNPYELQATIRELRDVLANTNAIMQRMEKEMAGLRAENAELKSQLLKTLNRQPIPTSAAAAVITTPAVSSFPAAAQVPPQSQSQRALTLLSASHPSAPAAAAAFLVPAAATSSSMPSNAPPQPRGQQLALSSSAPRTHSGGPTNQLTLSFTPANKASTFAAASSLHLPSLAPPNSATTNTASAAPAVPSLHNDE